MRKSLEAAFRRTHYRIHLGGRDVVLRVNHPEPSLAEWMQAHGVDSATLLTAFNPMGQRRTRLMNESAQRRLTRGLAGAGYLVLEGRNEDPRGLWPDEPALLVAGMGKTEGLAMAARFAQAALLLVDATGTPRLVEAAAPAGISPSSTRPRPRRCCPTRPAASAAPRVPSPSGCRASRTC